MRDAGRERSEGYHPIIPDGRLLELVELADVVRQRRQAADLARRAAQRVHPGVVDRLAHGDGVPEGVSGQPTTDVAGDGRMGAEDLQALALPV